LLSPQQQERIVRLTRYYPGIDFSPILGGVTWPAEKLPRLARAA
jgi:hypothetical protein